MTRPSLHPVLQSVRLAAQRLRLPGRSVLLAVSGGADSVAMLVAFDALKAQLGVRVEVACLDHGLRAEAKEDVRYVRQLCRARGLRFHTARLRLAPGPGVEARARRARYAALKDLAARTRLDCVATAHTAEDQAETLLFRLARGAGLRGARGILERRGVVVRPMLAVRRRDVAELLRRHGLTPREDPTNRSMAFARNRIRAQVLPALEQALGEHAAVSLARFARLAAEDERYLKARAAAVAKRLLVIDGAAVTGNARALSRAPAALRRRVLREAGKQRGLSLSTSHLLAMDDALATASPRSVGLPGGARFQVRYGRFVLGAPSAPPVVTASTVTLAGPGTWRTAGGAFVIRPVKGPGAPKHGSIRLDPSTLALPLVVRSRRPGDRFRPRGGGTRKLKAFLIDEKVPRERRDALPLLCDARGRILWIPGLRPGEDTAAGEQARNAWEIVWRSDSGEAADAPLQEQSGARSSKASKAGKTRRGTSKDPRNFPALKARRTPRSSGSRGPK